MSVTLVLALGSCTKKDELVKYPVTNTVVVPASGTGTFAVDTVISQSTTVSTSGNTMTIAYGNYSVAINFAGGTFADGTYNTNTSIVNANDITIEITNLTSNEKYVVEAGNTFTIITSKYPNTNKDVTMLTLAGSVTANPTVDPAGAAITASFSVYK